MALHKQKQVEQRQATFVMLSRAYRLWLIHYLVWQLGTLGRKYQVMMREPHRKFVIEESTFTGIVVWTASGDRTLCMLTRATTGLEGQWACPRS